MKKRRLLLQSGRKTDGAVAKSWYGKVLRLLIHSYTAQPFFPGRPSPLTPMNLWLAKTFDGAVPRPRSFLRMPTVSETANRGQIEYATPGRVNHHTCVCTAQYQSEALGRGGPSLDRGQRPLLHHVLGLLVHPHHRLLGYAQQPWDQLVLPLHLFLSAEVEKVLTLLLM